MSLTQRTQSLETRRRLVLDHVAVDVADEGWDQELFEALGKVWAAVSSRAWALADDEPSSKRSTPK